MDQTPIAAKESIPDIAVITYSSEEFEKATELINKQPVMEQTGSPDRVDQDTIVAMLVTNGLHQMAAFLSDMHLDDFHDFLVNHCGDD